MMSTKQQVIELWLQENAPHIQLLQREENSRSKSKFLDKNRNVEFYEKCAIVKRNIKRNPNTLFGATREELTQVTKENNLKKYGVDHPIKTKKVQDKVKKTNLEKYGVENIMQQAAGKERQKASLLANYGVTSPLKNLDIKQKAQETMRANYGVSHSLQNSGLKAKHDATLFANYGVSSPLKSDKIKEKIKLANIDKYGVENVRQVVEVSRKIEATNQEKYGFPHVFQNTAVKEKIKSTRIKLGLTFIHKGKTLKEWAEERGVSYSLIKKILHEEGPDAIETIVLGKTRIERAIEDFLVANTISCVYNKKLEGSLYRPDFVINSHKLIIECDGLFWHSEKVLEDNSYHVKKKECYDGLGYSSLFFRENEILEKPEIVFSIIGNKLGLSQKIAGRKTTIQEVTQDASSQFFTKNHLMGPGAGRTYGLWFDGELVAALRVKWDDRTNKILDISRFCNKIGHSVIGGYSKLIEHAIKLEEPNSIMTFVDRRYGAGEYLQEMKFVKTTEYISFGWTNGEDLYHRLTYPSNTGYDAGLVKIFDCGQAKYVRQLYI